jgi:hypothetical protein
MYRCTAVAELPPPPDAPEDAESRHALCELVEGHEGEHADHLWDEDAVRGAVWVLWDDSTARLVLVEWCEVSEKDDGEDACTLFRGHPDVHSWSFTDPTMEALRAEVAREMQGKFGLGKRRKAGEGEPDAGPGAEG